MGETLHQAKRDEATVCVTLREPSSSNMPVRPQLHLTPLSQSQVMRNRHCVSDTVYLIIVWLHVKFGRVDRGTSSFYGSMPATAERGSGASWSHATTLRRLQRWQSRRRAAHLKTHKDTDNFFSQANC
jgi:hypothetical protein